jgi:hypothetical protein
MQLPLVGLIVLTAPWVVLPTGIAGQSTSSESSAQPADTKASKKRHKRAAKLGGSRGDWLEQDVSYITTGQPQKHPSALRSAISRERAL